MAIWAIVPVKPFLRSKSRLAGVLSPPERVALSQFFLRHVLQVLAQAPAVARTLVVSRDPGALALARTYRAKTVTEGGTLDLNLALTRATHVAEDAGATAVLILPTDLPFLALAEVQQLIAPAESGPVVVISPDRHDRGTNALFVRPPGLITYAFGADSFRAHTAFARLTGAELKICRLPGVALDVDGPEDLALFRAAQPQD